MFKCSQLVKNYDMLLLSVYCQSAGVQVFGGSKFKPEYPEQLVLLFPRLVCALCQSIFRHSTKHNR